jgi:hypothetical protein
VGGTAVSLGVLDGDSVLVGTGCVSVGSGESLELTAMAALVGTTQTPPTLPVGIAMGIGEMPPEASSSS